MAYLKATANIVRADHQGPLDPERPNVAVTFDDAFRSVRDNALPSLARHGVHATIYVPSGWLGKPPGWAMETSGDADEVVMSGDELLALPRDIVSFGSHTVGHPHLTRLSDDEVYREFADSRAALEALFGETIDTLAVPYGHYDGRSAGLAARAGYRHIYSVAPQAIAAGDRAVVRGRTSVEPTDPIGLFGLKARGAYAWMPIASRLKRALTLRS
jgi:peptidoglycan/xylan/chitin deacetylase (PgdA/CDA1 family)